ncbi:MAG TPA: hypothetical protein VGN20_18095 [Mucilaginibacter sp.]|jgi:hypothetical protein
MRAINKILLAAAIVIVCGLTWSCGKGGGGIGDILIPNIGGVWANQANANDQFSFFNAPTNAATGTFDGNQVVNGTVTGTLTGSFNHSKISFVVTPNDNSAARSYSGTISGPPSPVMVLTSAGKKFTYVKQ